MRARALGKFVKTSYSGSMRVCFGILIFWFLCPFVLAKDLPLFEPESPEAWAYVLALAEEIVPEVYEPSTTGLRCKLDARSTQSSIESLAFEKHLHPALLAESLAAYFWSDWTLLQVQGFDIGSIVAEDLDEKALEQFLEAFYQQHEPCLLTALRILVDGYEGYYKLQRDGRYLRLNTKTGEAYSLIALSGDYFPGSGIFEPLGIVYGVRLAGLLKLDIIRRPAVEAISKSIAKRLSEHGTALKMF